MRYEGGGREAVFEVWAVGNPPALRKQRFLTEQAGKMPVLRKDVFEDLGHGDSGNDDTIWATGG